MAKAKSEYAPGKNPASHGNRGGFGIRKPSLPKITTEYHSKGGWSSRLEKTRAGFHVAGRGTFNAVVGGRRADGSLTGVVRSSNKKAAKAVGLRDFGMKYKPATKTYADQKVRKSIMKPR